jgi:uncharacterized protein YjbI with pentapeptide repeats
MARAAPSPQGPRLPELLEPVEIAGLHHDATVSESQITGASLVDQRANGVRFATVELTNVELSGSHLEHLSITDGALRQCNLANVHARAARATASASAAAG